MKELSIEEKAKRYDEALKVAKENYETIVPMDKTCTFSKVGLVNTFHHIFPELAESEDEKVRKELLLDIPKVFPHDKAFRYIAYLENQGEQKPNYCHHEVDLSDCSEEYRKAYYDGWNNCNQQHAQLKAEQNPAWSEEDDDYRRDVSAAVNDYFDESYAHELCNWLKSLKKRFTWKPSDEYKEAIQLVYDEKLIPFKDGNQWCFLLGDNIQEGVCGFGDSILEAAFEFYKDYTTTRKCIGELSRPQSYFSLWKPSDEQMKALLSNLPVVKGGGDKVKDILESLYQDLKKLREE